jgi:hypothetical protein
VTSLFDDLSALRLDDTNLTVGVSEVLAHVPVRKPNRHEFVRVHPDPDYALPTTVLTDRVERESYLVAPAMWGLLADEARPMLLVPAITRQGAIIIWPLRLPGEDGRYDTWAETAHAAAELAKEQWVRLQPNMALGAYRTYRAEGQLSDPDWPDRPFGEILEIAFRDRVIKSDDHPVVRRLRGLV